MASASSALVSPEVAELGLFYNYAVCLVFTNKITYGIPPLQDFLLRHETRTLVRLKIKTAYLIERRLVLCKRYLLTAGY